jgi:hypothetical protein
VKQREFHHRAWKLSLLVAAGGARAAASQGGASFCMLAERDPEAQVRITALSAGTLVYLRALDG